MCVCARARVCFACNGRAALQMAQGMMSDPQSMEEMMRELSLGAGPHMVREERERGERGRERERRRL